MKLKNNISVLIILMILSFIFVALFSTSTSFLYGKVRLVDEAIFQIIGHYWVEGSIPYVDLWDLKGPITFAIHALGYMLSVSKYGMFIVQIVFLTTALYFGYKLLLIEYSKKQSLILSSISLFSLLSVYACGVTVSESYSPLLMASFYCIYKWSNNLNQKEVAIHNVNYSFLYGLSFGFALFSRLTNALGLCGAIAVIFIYLLTKRQWKNIGANIFYFLLGLVLITMPFIIYFAVHGALYEMWYGTILYNLEYTTSSNNFFTQTTFSLLKSNINGIFLLVLSFYLIIATKEKWKGLLFLFSALMPLCWLLNSSGFTHYSIILWPYFYICIVELKRLSRYATIPLVPKIGNMFVCLFALGAGLKLVYVFFFSVKYYENPNPTLPNYEKMVSMIPDTERNSFCAYNCNPDIYYYTDIKPCYKYFCLQDMEIELGKTLLGRIQDTYENGNAKWILVEGNPKETNISKILNTRYSINKVDTNAQLWLYRLK